ncbi:MAG: hypothetical protein NTW85_09810 [Methylococcales bacterium]|nr:hypothetical protein [Methylococcales bacterium]
MNKKTITTTIVACGFIAAISMPLTAGADNKADNKDPSVYGKTYAEWSAKWSQWAYSSPENRNPIADETGAFCAENQPKGEVWFLAGSFGKTGVVRDCPIPANKALFYPIIEAGWIDCPNSADADTTDADVRNVIATGFAGDGASLLTSTLDGVPVSSLLTPIVRTQSPNFTANLPANNIWIKSRSGCSEDLPAGKTGRVITDGYWIMLPPLKPGIHTLTLHGASANWTLDNGVNHGISDKWNFDNEVTYHLTVLADEHEHDHDHDHHK